MSLLELWLGVFLISVASGTPEDQFVQVQVFRTCPEYPDLPNRLDDYEKLSFRRDPETEEYFMTGKLIITEPILENTTSNVEIKKCMSEDTVSCQPLFNIVEPTLCDHLGDPGKVWSSIIAKIRDFEPTCPIATGEYMIDDALIDMSVLTTMNLLNDFYQIQLLFTYLEEPMMCVVAEGEMHRMRRKKTKKPVDNEEAARRAYSAKSGSSSKRKSSTKSRTSF